eukprot:9318350-Pyramimonas_sp.AAC.1
MCHRSGREERTRAAGVAATAGQRKLDQPLNQGPSTKLALVDVSSRLCDCAVTAWSSPVRFPTR